MKDHSPQYEQKMNMLHRGVARKSRSLLSDMDAKSLQNQEHMKKDKKRSLMIHSYKAIGIGLMAWVAGTVAIGLWRMMGSGGHKDKKPSKGECRK